MGYPKLICPGAPTIAAMDDVAVSLDDIESDLEDALAMLRAARSRLHTSELGDVPGKLASALASAKDAAKSMADVLPACERWAAVDWDY